MTAATRFRLWAWLLGVEAPRALLRYRVRTFLSALGIMIGVAAVIWVEAIGRAGTERVQDELRKLGNDLVWIEAGSRTVSGLRTGSHGTTTLTPEDAEAIRREVPRLVRVSENVDGHVQVASGRSNWNTHYRGVAPDYLYVKSWTVAAGEFVTADQVRRAESVLVLGETVRQRLFGPADPLGAVVRVGHVPFLVIGVLAPKGQTGHGQDLDDQVVIPWTTAQKKLRGHHATWLDDILCSAASREAVEPAIADAKALLRERHALAPGQEDDFNVRRPDEVIHAQLQASRTLGNLLVALAAIALVVGGIGIMNIMVASVAARTREIGIRAAVGATPGALRVQFLGEAVLLSLLGAGLGIALALGGASVVGGLVGWRLSPNAAEIALAVGVATGVGLAAGYYPAWRASRLDPIDALRAD